MLVAAADHGRPPIFDVERPEAEAVTVLRRFISDTGAFRAELRVRDDEGDALLLSCGAPEAAWISFEEIRIDSTADETLVLSVMFEAAGPRPSLSAVTGGMHPAVPAFFRSWWRSDRALRRHRELEALPERSGRGWILIDAQHRICWANAKAHSLLAASDTIRRSGPFIAASTMADTVELRRIMMNLPKASAAPGMLMLPRKGGRPPLVIFVSRLPGAADPAGATHVLEVIDPDSDPSLAVLMISEAYHLSPAEQSIVVQLVAGYSIVQAADEACIKLSTARSHLQSIFIKMNVKSQAGLMRLLLLSIPT